MSDFLDQTSGAYADAGKDPRRPNVLVICCDHLRGDWLGCNGHPVVMTPQVDKLAYAGVNFRSAFSECPVCVPARRILMTGRGPYGVHMTQNRDDQPFPEGPKLAELLTRAGYQTFAAGKLHVCPQRNRIGFEDVQLNEEGRKQGGLRADDYEMFLADSGHAHLAWTHGIGNNQYGLRINPLPERLTTTHWTAQKAMEFIERRDPDRPFFLYVSFDKPHPPIIPPAEYYELYRDAEFPPLTMGDWTRTKLPSRIQHTRNVNCYEDLLRNPRIIQQSLRGFAAMVTHIDSMIGSILGTLREHGLFANTWVIFTSDHGDQLFDHGNFAKGDFMRGSTNVPFIIQPPERWRAQHKFLTGRGDDATPVGLADIMPTILDVVGLPIPAGLDGESLLPRITNPAAPFRRYTCGVCGVVCGITDGRFKYQWFSDDDIELMFDTHEDPQELHDLSADSGHADRLRELRSQMMEWMRKNGDPRVADGRLKSQPHDWHLDRGTAPNIWNNRGRH